MLSLERSLSIQKGQIRERCSYEDKSGVEDMEERRRFSTICQGDADHRDPHPQILQQTSNGRIVMKYPKLYTKNEKGRYDEYQIPDMDVSKTLFRRINGKYVPVSVNYSNDLPEGVWVVTRGRSSREIISGKYLKELMRLDKVADLKEMPCLAELGNWQKCAKYVLDEIGDFESMTMNEIVYAVVRKVFEYSNARKRM